MPSFNKLILAGNLTRDPELAFLPDQTPIVKFGLAVNEKYKTKAGEDRENVLFIDCTAFRKTAEVISQYCQKGKALLVEGKLKLDVWEDKNGGGKRSKHTMVVDNFQFLGSKGDSDEPQEQAQTQQRRPQPVNHRGPLEKQPAGNYGAGKPRQEQVEQPFGDEQTVPPDDIPFAWEGRRSAPL